MTDIRPFLRTKIIDIDYVYIDYWSFVHFFTGWAMYSFFFLSVPQAFWLMVMYEVVERVALKKVFRPETTADSVWDVIIGMFGYFMAGMV
ncbi:MAG: hypothetical protein DRP42_04945 [Tenericutes bacterium]|nr:MAG: hypothetical protein DRP42_04945 [Mycoplasmatota bacterium]